MKGMSIEVRFGQKGIDGKDGISITHVDLNSDGQLVIRYSDGKEDIVGTHYFDDVRKLVTQAYSNTEETKSILTSFEKKIKESELTVSAEVETIKNEHAQAVADMQREHANTVNDMKSEHASAVADVTKLKEEINELNNFIKKAVEQQLETSKTEFSNTITTKKQEVEQFVNGFKSNIDEVTEKTKQSLSKAESDFSDNVVVLSNEIAKNIEVVEQNKKEVEQYKNEVKQHADDVKAIKNDLSKVFVYKGSVNSYGELPTENKVGDTYNVINEDTEHKVNAGSNVVWNGTDWDNLGGTAQVGPRGERGEKGERGEQGLKGDKGDPGTTTWDGITNKPNIVTDIKGVNGNTISYTKGNGNKDTIIIDHVKHTENALNAVNAKRAEHATCDQYNNFIDVTYATKEELADLKRKMDNDITSEVNSATGNALQTLNRKVNELQENKIAITGDFPTALGYYIGNSISTEQAIKTGVYTNVNVDKNHKIPNVNSGGDIITLESSSEGVSQLYFPEFGEGIWYRNKGPAHDEWDSWKKIAFESEQRDLLYDAKDNPPKTVIRDHKCNILQLKQNWKEYRKLYIWYEAKPIQNTLHTAVIDVKDMEMMLDLIKDSTSTISLFGNSENDMFLLDRGTTNDSLSQPVTYVKVYRIYGSK